MTELTGMLFDGWMPILRTVLMGALAYAALVAMLRISGNRTLAKLNAFDLVVTVALGSTLATILLSGSVALATGITALATLIGLQWAVARASVASNQLARGVRSEAVLLMRSGEILHDALRRERVTETELMSVIRRSDTPDPNRVAAVVLESDGSFSVLEADLAGGDYASADLRDRLPDEPRSGTGS